MRELKPDRAGSTSHRRHRPPTRLAPGFAALTAREREVVMRLLTGKTGKETAFELGIAHATVRVLLGRARARLGVSTQHELLALPALQALCAKPVSWAQKARQTVADDNQSKRQTGPRPTIEPTMNPVAAPAPPPTRAPNIMP